MTTQERAAPLSAHIFPTLLDSFRDRYGFPLDPFQLEAVEHLDRDRSILVAAPTGTGKTLIAEYAVFRALSRGQRVFYTAPIKALSNQKYRDFRAQYSDAAGLLTGDVVVQPRATATVDPALGDVSVGLPGDPGTVGRPRGGQIVVMTTEVLRNMLLQAPQGLDDVGCVVFDEIHYMADPTRGTTWEEAIICMPKHVQLVCLSATVANAREIADWIGDVHRETHLVYHEERAVPLQHFYLLDGQLHLAVDAEGRRVTRFAGVGGEYRRGSRSPGGNYERRPRLKHQESGPEDVVGVLKAEGLVPAIYFLFSRRDVEEAAEACVRLQLAHGAARPRIAQICRDRLSHLAPEDRELGQVRSLARLLPLGVGFHHAGLLPVLKVLVEELFCAGLLGVVFATDTLSLGINMPARTVVVGEFSKFDGESRRILTPNEYRQLTGRAGRRGIDSRGTAVVAYSPWVAAEDVYEVATGAIQPVQSAFLVRYNTVLNLWDEAAEHDPAERIAHLMASSLREHQVDGQLLDLRERQAALRVRAEAPVFACDSCTPETLAEYEWLRRQLPHARKEEERAQTAERLLLGELDARPWQPSRFAVRQALRDFSGGEPIHAGPHGWGIYLSRLAEAQGAVALALFSRSARVLHSFSEVDYLLEGTPRVELPAALLGLLGEVADVGELVGEDEVRRLESRVAALDLPDVGSIAARHQEAIRAALEPRLSAAAARVAEAKRARREVEDAVAAHPCRACPNRRDHHAQLRAAEQARWELEEAEKQIQHLTALRRNRTRRVLRSIQRVLERFGYLKGAAITPKGEMLRDIFDSNGLVVCEAIDRGLLDGLSSAELAEALSWFAYDRDQSFPNRYALPPRLVVLRSRLEDLESAVLRSEAEVALHLSTGFSRPFYGVALAWCQGASFEAILSRVSLSEGDLVLTLNKTLDLMRQVREMLQKRQPTHPLVGRLSSAERQVRRGIVEQCTRAGIAAAETPLP